MASRHLERGSPTAVERPESSVMYLEVEDEPTAIARGWDELERRIGSLRGRRFLGTFDAGRYRASTVLREGDDPATLGLATGTVRGGSYLRRRLRGEPAEIYAYIPTA